MKRIFKFRALKLCAAVAALALLSGCSMKGFSPEDTIKAPGATGYYAGVQKALEQAVGNDIVLKYPKVGANHSAFCSGDFDGNGKDEVLAFYQKKGESAVTRMNLLSWENGKWKSVQDLNPVGRELIEAEISDLDLDGAYEIITGWQISTAKTNQLIIYKMEGGGLVQRADETYNAFVICDIDNNGRDDVGIAVIDAQSKKANLTFNDFENNTFKTESSIMLDGGVTEYVNVIASEMDGKTAVYLDGLKSSDVMITELIYYENGVLFNPFAKGDYAENTVTARRNGRRCKDVNGDGKIDIPLAKPIAGYNLVSGTGYYTDWSDYDGKEFKSVMAAWYCTSEGYYLILDEPWKDGVTVIFDSEKGTAVFCKWNSESKSAGSEIFRIAVFDSNKFSGQNDQNAEGTDNSEEASAVGYIALAVSDNKTFAVKFTDYSGEYSVTYEQLKEKFKFIVD